MIHLAVILGWLLDRSPGQRATDKLLSMLARLGKAVSLTLKLPGARRVTRVIDEVIRDGLFGEDVTPSR